MIAADYAKALYQLGDRADIKNLRSALKRRGHEKLLPRIYTEYQKLGLADERLRRHQEITPEKERTRVLLELYKKLVASPNH